MPVQGCCRPLRVPRNAETVPAARACDCCSTHQPRPGPVLQLTPVLRPYPRSPLGDGAAAHPRQAPPLDRASLHPGAGQQRLHPVMRGIQHASTTPAAAAACRLPTQACAPLDPAIPPPILRPDPQGPLPWSSHTRCSRCHSAPCRVIFGSREGVVSARPPPEGGGPELAGSRGSPPALQGSPSFGCNAPSLSHILRSFLRTNRPKLRRCCCLRGFTPSVTNDSHAPAQLLLGIQTCPAGVLSGRHKCEAWRPGGAALLARLDALLEPLHGAQARCLLPSVVGAPQPTRHPGILACLLTAQRAAQGVSHRSRPGKPGSRAPSQHRGLHGVVTARVPQQACRSSGALRGRGRGQAGPGHSRQRTAAAAGHAADDSLAQRAPPYRPPSELTSRPWLAHRRPATHAPPQQGCRRRPWPTAPSD